MEVLEDSELTRFIGEPNPSEPEDWERTKTSLRLGALRRRKGLQLGVRRMEREGEMRCRGDIQQRVAE